MAFIIYMLKVSVCTTFFYFCYHLFFKKFTFFALNRFCLLACLALSFTIPALHFSVNRERLAMQQDRAYHFFYFKEKHFTVVGKPISKTIGKEVHHINWQLLFVFCYWAVASVFLGMFMVRLCRLLVLMRRPGLHTGGLKLINKPFGFSNCSFLNYVFLDQQDLSSREIAVIVNHEWVHAKRLHSIDKIVISICKTLLWFNPVIYLIDQSLEQVHEFEADQVASSSIGVQEYANLLLNIAIRQNTSRLTHSFVKSPLKKRVRMLFTHQSSGLRKLSYIAILPVCGMLIGLFGPRFVYALPKEPNRGKYTVAFSDPDMESNFAMTPPDNKMRLIGWDCKPGVRVMIDGKKYDEGILTMISPRCVKLSGITFDQVTLTTSHGKVEFATATDIENAMVRIAAEKKGTPYLRYTVKNEKGDIFDFVRLFAHQSGIGLYVPKNRKILIILDGKPYSEKEASLFDEHIILPGSTFKGIKSYADMSAAFPGYANDYAAIIQVASPVSK